MLILKLSFGPLEIESLWLIIYGIIKNYSIEEQM
jgi:hypothetical protein